MDDDLLASRFAGHGGTCCLGVAERPASSTCSYQRSGCARAPVHGPNKKPTNLFCVRPNPKKGVEAADGTAPPLVRISASRLPNRGSSDLFQNEFEPNLWIHWWRHAGALCVRPKEFCGAGTSDAEEALCHTSYGLLHF
eukprot:scaffold417_cov252-Pinguiococcus_pyrenoidosus.AAC.36